MTITAQRKILIVDDNRGDVKLFQEALREGGKCYETTVAHERRRCAKVMDRLSALIRTLNLPYEPSEAPPLQLELFFIGY